MFLTDSDPLQCFFLSRVSVFPVSSFLSLLSHCLSLSPFSPYSLSPFYSPTCPYLAAVCSRLLSPSPACINHNYIYIFKYVGSTLYKYVHNCVHVQYIPYPVVEPRFLVPQNIRPTSWPTHGPWNKLIR